MTVTENAPAAGVDPVRWPDVATVPHSPLRAVAARRIFRRAAARLPLRVVESGGPSYGGGDTADPTMRLVRPASFFHRLGATGTIGFGEAYMAGDWTTEDLPGVLSTFAAHVRELVPAALQRLRSLALRRQPPHDDNTIEGARRILEHDENSRSSLANLVPLTAAPTPLTQRELLQECVEELEMLKQLLQPYS